MAQAASGMDLKKVWTWTATIIGILIMFCFDALPAPEPITPMGMKVLGVFIGVVWLWSFVSILWPSLLGIVAIIIIGYAPLPKVMQMSFGDTVPILVLFAMILFGAIQHAGVTKYISRWFLTRKIINGRPTVFNFVFMYTAYILSALSANVMPIILFMWAILYSVLEETGYKKGDRYTAVMVVGTLFGCISGQAAKPFTGSALMIMGAYEKVSGGQVDYLDYMLFGFIINTISIFIFSLIIKYVFRPDMSGIKNISIEQFQREKLPPMTTAQKIMTAALFGYLIMVLLPSILPKTVPGIALLSKIGPLGIVILFVVGLLIIRVDGKPIFDFKAVAGRYLVWDVYVLVAMAMAISICMTGEGTGIPVFLKNQLEPLLGGHSFSVFIIVLVTFGVCITQFANNAVMGVLLMSVVKIFSEQSGGSFEAAATIMTFALHMAILTPAASPYAAVIHGNKEWIDSKDVMKYGVAIVIMSIVLYSTVGVQLMKIIY